MPEFDGQVHFLELVEADPTKPVIGEIKIQLQLPSSGGACLELSPDSCAQPPLALPFPRRSGYAPSEIRILTPQKKLASTPDVQGSEQSP